MNINDMPITNVNHGKNIKAIREILRIKQDVLADGLGITQQGYSKIEQKTFVDAETREAIAKIMQIPVESIDNFSDDAAVNIIATTFTNTNHDSSAFIQTNHNPTFNAVDKLVEVYEKIDREKAVEILRLQDIINKKDLEIKEKDAEIARLREKK